MGAALPLEGAAFRFAEKDEAWEETRAPRGGGAPRGRSPWEGGARGEVEPGGGGARGEAEPRGETEPRGEAEPCREGLFWRPVHGRRTGCSVDSQELMQEAGGLATGGTPGL